MTIEWPQHRFLAATAVAVLIALPVSAQAQAPERFPDFGFLPSPDEYGGKLFKLSQKYPAPQPGVSALPDFFRYDFERQWKEYLLAARAYCFENNIGHADIEDDFRIEEAMKDTTKPVPWYHMPWQHFGGLGREGVHGLTKEAPVPPFALAKEQKTAGQTYAIAFYNIAAASTIGKVWAHFIPDPSVTSVPGGGFPEGSVIFKLLFITNPVEEIPFLEEHPWPGFYFTGEGDDHPREAMPGCFGFAICPAANRSTREPLPPMEACSFPCPS